MDARVRQESGSSTQKLIEIANRLDTGLDERAIRAVVDLLRVGVHPDTVVAVVSSLQQQDLGR